MNLHLHISSEEREDDIEQLLVVTFGVGVVAIWHSEEICLKEAEHLVEVVTVQGKVHLAYHSASFVGILMYIIGQKAFHQSHAYLTIGNVEGV